MEKKKALEEFLNVHFNITEESWRDLLHSARNRPGDEQVMNQLRAIVRALLLYFLDSPEYHFF